MSNYIPEKWSRRLNKVLHKKGVMTQCVNRNYEGEIKDSGDTVHIRQKPTVITRKYNGSVSYDGLGNPMIDLVVDQSDYFAFKVSDIEKAQSDVNILDEALGEAKIAIDLVKDTFLLSKHADVPSANICNGGSAITLTKDNCFVMFAELAAKLGGTGALEVGKGWVIIDTTLQGIIIQSPLFTHASDLGDKTLREGAIGRIAGLDVLVSTNFVPVSNTYYVLAGTNDAISFADQVTEIQYFDKLEGSFAKAQRGLYVYGAKTVLPAALAKAVVNVPTFSYS